MRDVYACSFRLVSGLADHASAPTKVADVVLEWLFEHAEQAPDAWSSDRGRWEDGSDYAEWSTLTVPGVPDQLWSLTFFHADRGDPTLGWRSTVQVAREGDELRFLMRLAIEALQMRILPARFEVGRPRIVRTVIDRFGAEMDDRPLSTAPWVAGSGEVGELSDLLLSSTRRLPVIAITADPATGRSAIDERRVASQVAGIAHVVYMPTAPATYELTDRIGKMLSVFGGAVRVYWPGLSMASDPFDHRLWMPERIAAMEATRMPLRVRLMRLLSSVAVLRVPSDPLGRKLRLLADEEQRRELDDLRQKLEQAPDEFTDQLWADYQATVDRERALLDRVEQLEGDIAAQQQAFVDLTREYASPATEVDAEESIDVETVRDAVDSVGQDYSDVLVFLPEALDSADESTYPNVPKLHAALLTLGDVARAWRDGKLTAGFASAFRDAGLDYAPDVSEVTVGRGRGEYERRYGEHEIRLGPHLRLGRGTSAGNIARIYWWIDEDSRQLVIGHVGRHLRDGTT